MAQQSVAQYSVPIRLACRVFGLSETCYRYQAKHSSENTLIVKKLVDLADDHSDWGFGQCFLYLRNNEGYGGTIRRFIVFTVS